MQRSRRAGQRHDRLTRRRTELDRGTLTLIDNEIDQTPVPRNSKARSATPITRFGPAVRQRPRAGAHRAQCADAADDSGATWANGPFTYVVKPDSTVEVGSSKSGGKRRHDHRRFRPRIE